MDLHLNRIIPSFLQLTEENTNKISKFSYSLNPVYLSKLIVSIGKFIANMRQEFFHRKFISGKSHRLYIRDIHARSRGHPHKTRACSSLCYLSPSFLTLSTRGLALGETDSLSYVLWEWQWDCVISLWASLLYQVRYWHGSLSSNYPVTSENRASFLCLLHSLGKKISIESVWMYLM